jgi:pSer/pThr/pTyr-binding forkhead associated (FHA) protein
MTDVLLITQGPLAGRRIDLQGELVIGREGAAFTIEDSELSRRHAAVRPVGEGYEVEDLGSLNGTYVNGRRIDGPTRLAGGDEIKLGQTVLELEAAHAPATVASATPLAPPPVAAPAPSEPFGAYAVPVTKGRRRGIASRQLGPLLASWAVVAATAVALAIYFADH